MQGYRLFSGCVKIAAMYQISSGLSPVAIPRVGAIQRGRQHARDADGKKRLHRMDHEIHDDFHSAAPMEFCRKFVRPLLSFPFIPHHNGISRPPTPSAFRTQADYPYPIRSIRLIRLFFKMQTVLTPLLTQVGVLFYEALSAPPACVGHQAGNFPQVLTPLTPGVILPSIDHE